MKRLVRKSNHVEPSMHNEIEDKIVNPEININENQNPYFLLMKELFAATPFMQASGIGYEFARKIENGEYDHISSIEEAKNHWDEWLTALNDFLNEKDSKSLESAFKKKD